MVKSMTGYGKSSLSINSREYQVEIKAVNHKYIDINIKMPRIISYLEEDIRKLITLKIKRGKIDISITFDNFSKDGNDIKINIELAKIYIQNLRQLAEEENISSNIEVTEITRMPDVLTIKSNLDENQIKAELLQVTEEAVNQLINMRQNEGNRISEDILSKITQIENKKQEILDLSTGLKNILFSQTILLTDFLSLGGIGPTFINVSLISFYNLYLLRKYKLRINGLILAAFMTVIGFSFFGKNIF